ncbi:MAG: S8 family serine peptidase [Candidatus Thiodiazotropha sp. (ex Dulcina madagascariensis)]|nr:S8 family serine peptidase [Candidatus Thiodiazotropha sp. (ex Dulcina madagascariensis)]MCU7926087.1 S8 family serine peptidase [Candidatus Thiodiazotropha sp. (ex Dulcina madagascariensis)]
MNIYVFYIFILVFSLLFSHSVSLRTEPLDFVEPNSILSSNQNNKTTKLRPELIKKLHKSEAQSTAQIPSSMLFTKQKSKQQLVLVDAIAKGAPKILLDDLITLGLQSAGIHGRIISGRLPLSAFDKLDSLESLNEIRLSRIITEHGSVTSKGSRAMKSDLARQYFGVDGSGVTIGIISDSYNCLGGASKDKQSEDLPEQIVSVEDALDCTGKTDEGRALMQIIHDVAPGAGLIFQSGANGLANTANAILALAFDYKADIIVDDQKSLSANFFQEDALSQAVGKAVRAGVVYVTAAGNSARNSYQSPYAEYINIATQLNAHDFDPGPDIDIYQRIAVPEGLGFMLLLQWDSPAYSISGAGGAQTDLDIFIFDGIIQEYETSSGAIFGHANSKSALTVGAANYAETPEFGMSQPLVQLFSSAGGTPVMFDLSGTVLSNPYIPQKPDIVAPDNVNTTFFGLDTDDDGMPNISGTSAAAPHAAGVAALLLEINPKLQPIDIKQILQNTAIDILQRNNDLKTATGPGFDFDSGFGLIQAEAAVDLARNYEASDPDEPFDDDMDSIIVNDSDQAGGGGMIGMPDIFSLMIFFIVIRHHHSKSIKPISIPFATACCRLFASSFFRIWLT